MTSHHDNSRRDLERERLFLRKAAPGAPGWVPQVAERLKATGINQGDSMANRDISEMLRSLADACADVGAWAILIDQALDHANLETSEREALAHIVLDVARNGSWAAARTQHARLLLGEIETGKRP